MAQQRGFELISYCYSIQSVLGESFPRGIEINSPYKYTGVEDNPLSSEEKKR